MTEFNVQKELDAQRKWIEEHGGDLAGYRKRYGDIDQEYCYGDGGEAIYKADLGRLQALKIIITDQELRAKRAKRAPKKIQEKLHELRRNASLENASFGFKTETLKLKYRASGMFTDQLEWTVDEFIKERTRLHRQSWILPLIDELIEWTEGD
jgi:hypothetical protein